MGTELLGFETEGGATVVFAVPDTDPGVRLVARGVDDVIPGPASLEAALDTVRTTADAVLGRLDGLDRSPDAVEVEFGLQMSAKLGAVIASAEAQGHLRVKITWQAKTSPTHPG
jgi:hypothetical protein